MRRGVGIIFITHFLEQVYAISDRITVQRNGRLVGTRDTGSLERKDLVSMMLGREQTARLMGVPVARTMIAIYALSGFLAGLSGIVFSLYTSAGYSLAAVGVELDAIAAVVIGGTLLTGGAGFVAGVLIQGLIQTYITFDGTLSSW